MCSFSFNNVYLGDYFSIAGLKEAQGNIASFDLIIDDNYFGEPTFEDAEIKMQKTVIDYLYNKCQKIDVIVGGELSDQIAITSYMMSNYPLPYIGCYNACATFNEALIILSFMLESNKVKTGIGITSSHNLVAERQFRYPVEYGAPKPKRSTYTDRKSTRLNSSHQIISYAVFCLK